MAVRLGKCDDVAGSDQACLQPAALVDARTAGHGIATAEQPLDVRSATDCGVHQISLEPSAVDQDLLNSRDQCRVE
jgi:hypothetical protein